MLILSEKHNPNYVAQVVELKNVRKHSNADRLQCVSINFNNVITGLDAKDGDAYIYFPVESSINKNFLSQTNSFSKAEMNIDKDKVGFFGKSGRVKAIKLRGEKSAGYIVPVRVVADWAGVDLSEFIVGTEFDMIGDKLICEKYVVPTKAVQNLQKQGRKPRVSRLIDNQFRFHIDTSNLRNNAFKLNPDMAVSITYKTHGTSGIVGNILVKKKLSWKDKIAKFLGITVQEDKYDYVYASRRVVKNEYLKDEKRYNHFYNTDVWAEAKDLLKGYIPKGYTLYFEILGYTKEGSPIQGKYDYGCEVGEKRIQIYRITFTNPDGLSYELSNKEIRAFCDPLGLETVHNLYEGRAGDLFPNLEEGEQWNENFIPALEAKYNEKDCFMCKNKVVEEGIVLRIDKPNTFEVYKLKSFGFLAMESSQLDKEVIDIESIN